MARKIFIMIIAFLNILELILVILKVSAKINLEWIIIFIPLMISEALLFFFLFISILKLGKCNDDE